MRDLTKIGEKINSYIGKAIHDYEMIREGDRILVAISGGKDSWTLLDMLKKIQGWAPVSFELIPAHIRSDFSCGALFQEEKLKQMVGNLALEYHTRDIHVLDKEQNASCFWCAGNRRKALFEMAEKLQCNKVALGHHKDDIVETVLLNLLCHGEIAAMNPKQELFDGKVTLIRPLCYVAESTIRKYIAEKGFRENKNACRFGKDSKREYVKSLIKEVEKNIPGYDIKSNIFRSLSRIKEDYIDLKAEGPEQQS